MSVSQSDSDPDSDDDDDETGRKVNTDHSRVLSKSKALHSPPHRFLRRMGGGSWRGMWEKFGVITVKKSCVAACLPMRRGNPWQCVERA